MNLNPTSQPNQQSYRIGDIARLLGLTADTLRYYEKIGLLPRVGRNGSGLRSYTERDVSRLRFIQRAQKMSFSLTEIGMLLTMRDNPQCARNNVRKLTATKLQQVEAHLDDLILLRNELLLLLNLCQGAKAGCPIIETMGGDAAPRRKPPCAADCVSARARAIGEI